MIVLALGIVLFAVLHLVPVLPDVKVRLKGPVGERAYGPVYGIVSVIALALIVVGWRHAPFVAVYQPAWWGRYVNFGLTFLAFLCLGIFLFRGRLRQVLRFPMGIAVLLWGIGHLFANGDMAGLILFGGMMVYAALHIGWGLAQGVRPTPEVRDGHDLLSLMAGAALYGVMSQAHPLLIGVPIFLLTH